MSTNPQIISSTSIKEKKGKNYKEMYRLAFIFICDKLDILIIFLGCFVYFDYFDKKEDG